MKKRKKGRKVKGKVLKKMVSRKVGTCYFCGTTKNITEHHIIFKFCGGEGLENNKEHICDSCHQKFHALAQPMINLFLNTIKDLQKQLPKPTRKIGFIRTNGKKKGGKKG